MATNALPAPLPGSPPSRLVSLDAFRGFVMFLMAAELLEVPQVAQHFPDSAIWQFLARHSEHVAWTGCSLHDLIQPAFSFMVGVALPFSIASRSAKGQSKRVMWFHALWRSLVLVLLGVFLRSMGPKTIMTNWTFEDTLSQIGLGYPLLFLLGFAGNKVRWSALALLLIGYWLAFATFRLPPDDFVAPNVPPALAHFFDGFMAHWNMNSNAAWAFDKWFLNLFPREAPFIGNRGGYSTLSFIPTLGTMVLGLIAGSWLQSSRVFPKLAANPLAEEPTPSPKPSSSEQADPARTESSRVSPKLAATTPAEPPPSSPKPSSSDQADPARTESSRVFPKLAANPPAEPPPSSPKPSSSEQVALKLIFAGLACLAAGWLLNYSGLCPIVKKIWTPAWTLYSGGWCFLMMAAFYFIVDLQGWKRWAFPLVVIGMNSIAMYVLVHTTDNFFAKALYTHFGKAPFLIFGETFEPMLHGGAVLLILWLILLWMHRRKLWLRI